MEFERVGGTRPINVDVRILSASNRNLKEDVAQNLFREDLFYRLNVINIEVPSLRERLDDIPLLVNHFIKKYSEGGSQTDIKLSPEVWKTFYAYAWPGNVRELENIIERGIVLNSGGVITIDDLSEELVDKKVGAEVDLNKIVPLDLTLPEALEQIEEKLIKRALDHTDQVQAQAAEILGISRHVMHYKMKKFGMLK
jgi:two-component system NtrC family response regulator